MVNASTTICKVSCLLKVRLSRHVKVCLRKCCVPMPHREMTSASSTSSLLKEGAVPAAVPAACA